MEIYIANPLGFSEVGRRFLKEVIKPMLASEGYKIIDPFEEIEGVSEKDTRVELSKKERLAIGRANEENLSDADVVLAILDGPDVDSGTAAEIGYAHAKGKKIIGYRSDVRKSGDGLVNLQIETFIVDSGGEIVTNLEDLKEKLGKIIYKLRD